MSAPATDSKESKVAKIFKNLEYGPAPESPNIAYQWLDYHERKFGHFIDGKWVLPEGRKAVESKSPATGLCFISKFSSYLQSFSYK